MDQLLRIGQVGKKLGLNPKTIRYYEEAGLIPAPSRSKAGYASNGYRLFTQKDINRLEFILQAKSLNLSLNQIKELLDAVEGGCCVSARPHLKSLLVTKLKEIDEKIMNLEIVRTNLKRLHHDLKILSKNTKIVSSCSPKDMISQCAFGENPIKVAKKSPLNRGREGRGGTKIKK